MRLFLVALYCYLGITFARIIDKTGNQLLGAERNTKHLWHGGKRKNSEVGIRWAHRRNGQGLMRDDDVAVSRRLRKRQVPEYLESAEERPGWDGRNDIGAALAARQDQLARWLSKRQAAGDPSNDPDAMKVANKQAELQALLQQLYEAEAAVKMESGEVTRTQQVAQEAQQALEEATNKVRMLSADLQAAQEAAAAAAMRAHTAQLQLSAHDQLMFTARQRVDALSAQMVSVQAELASAQQMFTLSNSTQHLEQQGKILEPSLVEDFLPGQEMGQRLPAMSFLPQNPFPPYPPMRSIPGAQQPYN